MYNDFNTSTEFDPHYDHYDHTYTINHNLMNNVAMLTLSLPLRIQTSGKLVVNLRIIR